MNRGLSRLLLVLALALPAVGWAVDAAPAPGANPLHPLIRPVDEQGRPLRGARRRMDEQASCGSCHDVGFIRANSAHWTARARVDCLACHLDNGALPAAAGAYDAQGTLKRDWTRLHEPTSEACLACHGLGTLSRHPLVLPQAYVAPGNLGARHAFHFSREAGTVFSGQTPRDSGLNLADKDRRNAPWDVHAARLLQCASCHSSPNSPGRAGAAGPGSALLRDPRHEDLAAFLRQPSHRLRLQDCRQCHDASQGHAFLPYAQRHLDRLACQACHVAKVQAPVLMEEDRSVAL